MAQAVVEQPSGLGESPFWHPGEQRLYWLDIPGRHHRAREAEADIRELAVEVFGRLGLDVRPLAPGEL